MPISQTTRDRIRAIERLKDRAADDLLNATADVQQKILRRLIGSLSEFSLSAGEIRLTNANIARLNKLKREIAELFAGDAALAAEARTYIKALDRLSQLTLNLYAGEGLDVDSAILRPIRTVAVDSLEDQLLGAGLQASVIDPLIKDVSNLVLTGAGSAQLEESIMGVLTDGPNSLVRHVRTLSNDTVNQFDGAINERIGKELGLEWVLYVGSIIDASRKQCRRWVDREYLHKSEFAEEVKWAEKNGSGMIPGTNAANFTILRGGYNCRHKIIYVTTENVPEKDRERVGK